MNVRMILLVILAFSSGWWLRGQVSDEPSLSKTVHTYTRETTKAAPEIIIVEKNQPSQASNTRVNGQSNSSLTRVTPSPLRAQSDDAFNQFRDLLQQLRFVEAVQWYDDWQASLAVKETEKWQSHLTDFLAGKLNSGENQSFSELSSLWLQQHYNDIDVLLLVAQFNRNQGFFTEALQSYLQARTYAYNEQQRKRVQDELQSYIYQRDTELVSEENWQSLLTLYEQLFDLDIASDSQIYRYAELLLMQGQEETAFALLEQLAERSTAWKPKVKQLRAQYQKDGRYHAGNTQSTGFQSALTMQPAGSHYLVSISINDYSNHTLLLDTGASITMLTEDSFYQASAGGGWKSLGYSLFNTANGIVRGRMMQVEKLQIGEYTLTDVRVAVQPTEFGEGVEGLLGMNVLRHFQFQIDQDKHRLLMSPR